MDDQFFADNSEPRAGIGPSVDPEQLARLVLAAQAGRRGQAQPVNSTTSSAGGVCPLVDSQQLAQLVMAARALQRGVQPAGAAGQPQAPAASVLGPTDPFASRARAASGFGPADPQTATPPAQADPSTAAAIKRVWQSQASAQPESANAPRVVDVMSWTKAASRIPRPAAADAKPNLRVSDPNQSRRTLDGLMRGIGGPQNPPLGVLPDGSLVRDLTYLAKAPSRIPRQYASGEYYSNVNTGWITTNEGGSLRKGYVPRVKGGSDNSGVTIAAGFDLGQHSLDDLRQLNLSEDLTKRLSPYLGLTGKAARDALAKQSVTLSRNEAAEIDDAAFASYFNNAAQTFDQTAGAGEFARLPWQAQTVIADLWYNMGDLSDASVAPVFWKQVTTGDWEGAYRNLRNFSQKDPRLADRARGDSKLLRDAIDIGTLPRD